MYYNPDNSPPTSDSDSKPRTRRVLRSVPNENQSKTTIDRKPSTSCDCAAELGELRQEVKQLTLTINEMNEIVRAKLLFPHLSLAEALSAGAEVTYDHVKAPKRPRTDSALYLPDIPDGFSDSTAHSLVFRRRTKVTTAEQECKRASKKLQNIDSPGRAMPDTDTIVVKGPKPKASTVKNGRVAKPVTVSIRTRSGGVRKE